MNYKEYFKDKKIAIIGLGPHGEMISDIKFLLKCKANISLYDIRSEERIKKYAMSLSVGGLSKMTFGKVPEDELINYDLIILSSEISKRSIFLRKAINAKIEIEFTDTIFFKLAPPIILIGIIGVCGKSAVSHLLYGMLKKSFSLNEAQGLYLIDSDSMSGTLNILKKIKKDDILIIKIPENMLEQYYQMRISPHVAIITTPISYKILEYQTQNNFIIATDNVIDNLKLDTSFIPRAKILRTRAGMIPNEWNIVSRSIHYLENASLALQASELFKVPRDISKDIIQSFLGFNGHIELVKKINGIDYYNDASSTSPLSTLAALRYLSKDRNIILIFGGAYTGYDYDELIRELPKYIHIIILISGSGTIGIRDKINKIKDIECFNVLNIEQAINKVTNCARKGDIVLYSPGFDAVGIDISRKDRGNKFIKALKKI